MKYDVCVIGTGRVGLPLALSFIDVGLSVSGVDVDENLIESVSNGKMPFHEPGYDELVARGALTLQRTPEVVEESRAVVITVGTPLHNHIETDLSQIKRVLGTLKGHLREGQFVCLRSTVARGRRRT